MAICLLLWTQGSAQSAPAPREWTPLQILQQVLKRYPGRIIKMEPQKCPPQRCLQVKLLLATGQVRKLVFRADNGQLVKDELQQVKPGEVLPLKGLMPLEELVKRLKGGRLLEAELEFEDGQLVYELEWLDAQGQVWEQTFEAYSGKLISTEKDD
ncbi:MAG: PepSY domain-containing protein [Candidatus Sericytochromatia bacterium]